jgi:lysozyme
MQLSENGRKLIQSFEGLSLKAYPDAAGYSIGYGHFGAKQDDVITHEEADRLFRQDVLKFETIVALVCPIASQQQFDAMTSLAYNIGTGAFAKSTVATRHNMKDWAGAADAFRMWNKSQGQELPVLTNRRERERAVYIHGYDGTYTNQSANPVSAPVSDAVLTPSKRGTVSQFFIGLLASVGLAYGLYTRTNLLQGRFGLRKKPRVVLQ